MDNNTLAIFIHELRNQIVHTQASFDLFNQAMQNGAAQGVLYGGQLVLMPASHLSNILWPTRARSRARGEALRKVLQLPEKHPLNDRRLSELWERADEKIDDFISTTKGKNVVIDFVGNPTAIDPNADIQEHNVYRAYDPETRVFYFRGVGYNFPAIANAISDLSGRIHAVWAQMNPEQAKAEAEEARKYAKDKADAEEAAMKEAKEAADTADDAKADAAKA